VGCGVIVQNRQEGGLGCLDTPVYSCAKSRICRAFNNLGTGRGAIPPGETLSAIIHHHHFEIAARLMRQGFYAIPEPGIGSQGRDHHCDQDFRQYNDFTLAEAGCVADRLAKR
jgi:hypothetical protein